ncbi:MAG: carboxypeptidase M32 [Bacilli bacterium]|jgi:carboxypeptidase Taq|nr:carboxypeptidase M32 [Bacilli bacterium]
MEETINIALSIYKDYQKQNLANKFVNFLIGWDSQTEAPNDCFEARGRQIEVLSTATYKLNTSPELVKAVQTLYENRTSLNEITAHEIVVVKKNIDKIIKVPMEEFVELSTLLASSQNIWAKAKVENNFELFKPTLKRIIELLKLYLSHLETPKLKGYNILLDEYEPGFTTKEYDEFFDTLKKELVPFVKKVATKALQYNHSFTNFKYPKDDQKKFAKKIMDTLCFNHNKGLMKESEHPFTTGFGTSDVRFTVHYHEDNLASAIFSAIHELGHATYEMQVDPALDVTLSGGGASLAMHESQSRFYENIIGRSPAFWKSLFPKLKEIFPKQFKSINLNDFLKHINEVKCSLIRTEADELTYPLHIMVRYDIEKALFNNEITVDELPVIWNKLMKEYLGVEVPNNKEGILQDIHWAGAAFGYFPTYALGSAYAAQIYHSMKKDLNIKEILKSSSTKEINEWLKEKIHCYGAAKYPQEILKLATKEKFKPQYYVTYLIKKYSKIYDIKW